LLIGDDCFAGVVTIGDDCFAGVVTIGDDCFMGVIGVIGDDCFVAACCWYLCVVGSLGHQVATSIPISGVYQYRCQGGMLEIGCLLLSIS